MSWSGLCRCLRSPDDSTCLMSLSLSFADGLRSRFLPEAIGHAQKPVNSFRVPN